MCFVCFCDTFKSIILFQKKRNKHNNTARLISWSNQYSEPAPGTETSQTAWDAGWSLVKTDAFCFKKKRKSQFYRPILFHSIYFTRQSFCSTLDSSWKLKNKTIYSFQINLELIGILMGLHGFRLRATVEMIILRQCHLFLQYWIVCTHASSSHVNLLEQKCVYLKCHYD